MGFFGFLRRKKASPEEEADYPGAFAEDLPEDFYVPPSIPPPQERPLQGQEAPMSRDVQLLSAKLDVITARLETLAHRLQSLEESLKGPRRW